jgi:hypothetical protein
MQQLCMRISEMDDFSLKHEVRQPNHEADVADNMSRTWPQMLAAAHRSSAVTVASNQSE